MSRVEVMPFTEEHLDAAGELLAARQRRHREAEPLVPERYTAPDVARAEVEALWLADDTPGAVALRDRRVVAYMVGIRKDRDMWGPNVWVDPAGHAAEEAEVVRDLYAAVSADWVAAGDKAHFAVVPATDGPLLEAWYRLGFGQQHAFGIRELPEETSWPEGTREARSEDIDQLLRLAPLLGEHQALSPVFAPLPDAEDPQEMRAEYEEDVARDDVGSIVAEQGGRIVGQFYVVPIELSRMHSSVTRRDGASFLSFAITDPAVRGSGAGLKLTQAAFAWARERGYDTMAVDWRVTNLLSSRFWAARGFRPTFFRLHRLVA
jgi:ribosomal protein S18 acetylase RimI-like enzyme